MKYGSIDWDHSYTSGHWDGCNEKGQMSRYALLGGLIALARGRSLLDVGCGCGLLRQFIPHGKLDSYTGLDVSQAAIDKITDRKPHEKFICSRIEAWEPDQQYDVIVLNEVLYYFDNACEALVKMHRFLCSGGSFIISVYRKPGWRNANQRALKLARGFLAENGLNLVEDIRFTTQLEGKSTWTILVALRGEPQSGMWTAVSNGA